MEQKVLNNHRHTLSIIMKLLNFKNVIILRQVVVNRKIKKKRVFNRRVIENRNKEMEKLILAKYVERVLKISDFQEVILEDFMGGRVIPIPE